MIIALWAALAMVAQDILGAVLTQAQARDRAVLAGGLDAAAWLVGILTTVWSINAIDGHNLTLKALVIGAVTAANFVGSWSGTLIGKRFVTASTPVATRVAEVERRLEALERQ